MFDIDAMLADFDQTLALLARARAETRAELDAEIKDLARRVAALEATMLGAAVSLCSGRIRRAAVPDAVLCEDGRTVLIAEWGVSFTLPGWHPETARVRLSDDMKAVVIDDEQYAIPPDQAAPARTGAGPASEWAERNAASEDRGEPARAGGIRSLLGGSAEDRHVWCSSRRNATPLKNQ